MHTRGICGHRAILSALLRPRGVSTILSLLLIASLVAHPWDVATDAPIEDARLSTVRDTDTRFEMTEFASLEEWQDYAEALERRIRVATGLWPYPEKTPLNARVFDTLQRDGYSVSKVHFEAYPGFLVTGNLYMPEGSGPFPGVIHPHGHWSAGRLENTETGSVPGRAITFARMGIAAFTYDMVGYNDSRQFSRNWSHSWDSVPLEERQRQALWGIHPFAVQLWSGIRALDFMESLPLVDGDRLGCTGASGGGTQTFVLSAIDPRVKVAAPVNMISHSMQGGCVCENAPLIRIGASNMEIGSMFAPKRLLMVSATGDWTTKTPGVEFPAVRSVYALFDASGRATNVHVDAPHNYNLRSREAVYKHFGTWLLEDEERFADFREPPFEVEARNDLRVFPGGVPIEGYARNEEMIDKLIELQKGKWAAMEQDSPETLRGALGDVFGLNTANLPEVEAESTSLIDGPGFREERYILRVSETGAAIPAIAFVLAEPVDPAPVLIVHGEGKAALSDANGNPIGAAREWLAKGRTVILIDVFRTGEMQRERTLGNFPDTFVPTDTAYRIQDILAAIRWVNSESDYPVEVVGLGEAGVWTLFAAALDAETGPVHVDFNGFNPDDDAEWVDRHYVPSIRSIGDVQTAEELIAPRTLSVTAR